MAILWAGGEDIDFKGIATPITTTAAYFRSGYGRCALYLTNFGSAGATRTCAPFPGGGVTNCWLSVQFYIASTGSYTQRAFGLGQQDTGNRGLFIGWGGTDRLLRIYHYDGTTLTTLATEAVSSVSSAEITKIDVNIISYGGDGTVNVYSAGSTDPVVTYHGDISVAGVTSLDCVMCCSVQNYAGISELIVADEDTRTFSLATLAPSEAGDANAWDNGYDSIDEITLSDADVIYTDVAEEDFQCKLSDLPAGYFAVRAVMESVRACKTAYASIGGLAIGIKTGGSANVGSTETLTTAWVDYQRLMNTNPVTTGTWSSSQINALQLDLRSKA